MLNGHQLNVPSRMLCFCECSVLLRTYVVMFLCGVIGRAQNHFCHSSDGLVEQQHAVV